MTQNNPIDQHTIDVLEEFDNVFSQHPDYLLTLATQGIIKSHIKQTLEQQLDIIKTQIEKITGYNYDGNYLNKHSDGQYLDRQDVLDVLDLLTNLNTK